jgi:hypothetical protein
VRGNSLTGKMAVLHVAVMGSSPIFSIYRYVFFSKLGMAEWSMAVDCKSIYDIVIVGSNPTSSIRLRG